MAETDLAAARARLPAPLPGRSDALGSDDVPGVESVIGFADADDGQRCRAQFALGVKACRSTGGGDAGLIDRQSAGQHPSDANCCPRDRPAELIFDSDNSHQSCALAPHIPC